MNDQLVAENEALHALLADACATFMIYVELGELGKAAQDCLDRISNNDPLSPFAVEE